MNNVVKEGLPLMEEFLVKVSDTGRSPDTGIGGSATTINIRKISGGKVSSGDHKKGLPPRLPF